MNKGLPHDVAQFLSLYLQRLEACLPRLVHGCYLYGSPTLDAYNPQRSDIDFFTVLERPLNTVELCAVEQMHQSLLSSHPLACRLEGEYGQREDLLHGIMTNAYPRYNYGKLQAPCPLMTLYWYQLHTAGIRLAGPEPKMLFPPIPWEKVEEEMERNINSYWADVAVNRYRELTSNEWVEFSVLTLCRIRYTMEFHRLVSKEAAGKWGLTILETKWHPLLHEAMRIRKGIRGHSAYPTRWQRVLSLQAFIFAQVEECNRRYWGKVYGHT